MKKIICSITLVLLSVNAISQNTIAKFKYEDAEKAFYKGDYQTCLSNLDEAEKLLGKSAPNILYLRIMAESKIWETHPYDNYEAIENLRNHCSQYLKNYDIKGLENKYRDVYDFSNQLSKAIPKEIVNQNKLTEIKLQLQEAKNKLRQEKAITENQMIFVKGGTFTMGDGKEAHDVTLSDYYIGKFEITKGAYSRFTGRAISDQEKNKPQDLMIDWKDCMAYCKFLEKVYGGTWRLPTEAEWEYAARGGQESKGFKYSGSDDLQEVAAKLGSDVGTKKPNELGIYDMIGNLTELCYDFWDRNYYENSPQNNPMGPDSGNAHVIKGGFDFSATIGISLGSAKTYSRARGFGNKAVEAFAKARIKKNDARHFYGFRVVYIPDK